jgi:hypothetical protein
VGQSHDGTKFITDPLYIWNNTAAQSAVGSYSPDECGNGLSSTDFIKEGRDYITDVAKPGYKKYPYPHPLRNEPAPPAPAIKPPLNILVK